MKLYTLFLAAVLMLSNNASAFTARPAATQVRPVANIAVAPPSDNDKSVTRLSLGMFVDWGVPDMDVNPIGSIILLVAFVSAWELTGRGVKKA